MIAPFRLELFLSFASDCRLANLGARLRPVFRLVLATAILAAALAGSAHAEGGRVYLVTYVSVMPNAVVSGATLSASAAAFMAAR
jgi:hypothetical protein